MTGKCPICGAETLVSRRGKFEFRYPPNLPGGPVVVEQADWSECATCKERILSPDLERVLNEERYRRLGLLPPSEIRGVRRTLGLSQTQMAEWLGVGEKTYGRWESGKSIHNISSDNLIRLAQHDPGIFVRLRVERDPNRRQVLSDYITDLRTRTGKNKVAVAAYGGVLEPLIREALLDRIHSLLDSAGRQ